MRYGLMDKDFDLHGNEVTEQKEELTEEQEIE